MINVQGPINTLNPKLRTRDSFFDNSQLDTAISKSEVGVVTRLQTRIAELRAKNAHSSLQAPRRDESKISATQRMYATQTGFARKTY